MSHTSGHPIIPDSDSVIDSMIDAAIDPFLDAVLDSVIDATIDPILVPVPLTYHCAKGQPGAHRHPPRRRRLPGN